VEAETQLRKAQVAMTAAQNLQTLSVAAYNNRIAQLGNSDSPHGIITIKSAIAGTVADQEITTGQSVADAGTKLMTIINDRQVMATANIYERDLGKVQLGQAVRVKVGTEIFEGSDRDCGRGSKPGGTRAGRSPEPQRIPQSWHVRRTPIGYR
jgi:multidrug resistance efflux pump